MKKNKNTVLELFILFSTPQRLGENQKMFGHDYVPFFQRNYVKTFPNIEQHNMEGGKVKRNR